MSLEPFTPRYALYLARLLEHERFYLVDNASIDWPTLANSVQLCDGLGHHGRLIAHWPLTTTRRI